MKLRFVTPRLLLLGLSILSTVISASAGAAHYRKLIWGDMWHPIGWLLSMFFLLLAFVPAPPEMAAALKKVVTPKSAFFLFWILFFLVSHLWNFSTAPWNGNSLFDESGWDLWYLKSYVLGHSYQAAWFHFPIARETLFHYYVWVFLKLFGFNILSYEAALLFIWLTTFVFTLLLVHLLFDSCIVTSVTALILNFLPFAFIYTFAGYRYPMATALAVVSLYFLHLGFKTHLGKKEPGSRDAVRQCESHLPSEENCTQWRGDNISEDSGRTWSRFYLSLGGIAAGLCLASSISGKQYLLALLIASFLYAAFYWKCLKTAATWNSIAIVVYGFLAAAMPLLIYIVFNREAYTYYESNFVRDFWQSFQTGPFPSGIQPYIDQCRSCFFSVPAQRFFIPDTLPIPLPYYWLLVPGLALAVWQKHFEIPLLAVIPVAGAFVAKCIENRLLLPIPFWVILISFTVAGILKLKQWRGVQIVLGMLAGLILLDGLIPSVRYVYSKTRSPFSIFHYAQYEVAVSRFLRHVVAGEEHPGIPHIERNEFNRINGIPDPAYDTLICQNNAYSIIHLFLCDYDDAKVLSFCNGLPFFFIMTEQDVWNANKQAVLSYVPTNKALKLIWEVDPKTQRIIGMFQNLRDLATEEWISFSFGDSVRIFYVLNIPSNNIRQFQSRVAMLPATAETALPPLKELSNAFEGSRGNGKEQLDSPMGIAVDGEGKIFIADTGHHRVEKFSPAGTFLGTVGITGNDQEQLAAPNGIAIDGAGNMYLADAGSHRILKLSVDGTFIAQWRGPEPGFYGPRRIALGSQGSIYVLDQGHTRIVKLDSDGRVLSVWGSKGTGDGQFDDPTSVAVDLINNHVYVADPLNRRVQVFDSNGKFLSKWLLPEWGRPYGFEDLAIDSKANRLYASSAHLDTVLVFDLKGTKVTTVRPMPPDRLEGPSALVLTNGQLYVLNMAGNHVSVIPLNQ